MSCFWKQGVSILNENKWVTLKGTEGDIRHEKPGAFFCWHVMMLFTESTQTEQIFFSIDLEGIFEEKVWKVFPFFAI